LSRDEPGVGLIMNARASFVLSMIGILVLGALGFPQDRDLPKEEPQDIKSAALQKSLLIPGWGQLSERKYVKAAVFFASECYGVYEMLRNNHRGNVSYALYKSASTAEDATKYRDLTERFDKKRNQFLLIAAGIWAINLVDIYVIVKKQKEKRGQLGLALDVSKEKALSFSLRYRY
jgi:hypothetical protein